MFKYKNQTHLFSITYHCGMHDNELYFYLDPANIKQCLTEATGSDYNYKLYLQHIGMSQYSQRFLGSMV
jgi:hypothetical protein